MDDRHCFEHELWRVLKAASRFWIPVVPCCVLAVGAHQVMWWRQSDHMRWMPLLAMSAALSWLFLGIATIGGTRTLGQLLTAASKAVECTFGQRISEFGVLLILVVILGHLTLPLWTGVQLGCSLLFIAASWPRIQARSIPWSARIYGLTGLLAIGTCLFVDNGALWTARTFSVVFTLAMIPFGFAMWPMFKKLQMLQMLAVIIMTAPLIFPYAIWIFGWDVNFFSWSMSIDAVLITGLFICPLVLYAGFFFSLLRSGREARKALESRPIRDFLGQDVNPEVESDVRKSVGRHWEDELRESDGYCQLWYPEYRNVLPGLIGESGYVCWFEPAEESVVFRASSFAPNPCVSRPDRVSQYVASLVKSMMPVIGMKLISLRKPLRELTEAVTASSNVELLEPRETMLCKLPWDHPYVLVIPVERIERLQFPVGSGIRDRDKLPCLVKDVRVRISLATEVIDAVNRVAQKSKNNSLDVGDAECVRICQELLWNAWRILPAVYETLLVCLIREVRDVPVGVLTDKGSRGFDPVVQAVDPMLSDDQYSSAITSKDDLTENLNKLVSEGLPDPLHKLIRIEILGYEVESEWHEKIHRKISDARSFDRTSNVKLQSEFSGILNHIHTLFTDGFTRKKEEENGQTRYESMHSRLHEAKQSILRTAASAGDTILAEFAKSGGVSAKVRALPEINNNVATNRDDFVKNTDERIGLIIEKMESVEKTFTERRGRSY